MKAILIKVYSSDLSNGYKEGDVIDVQVFESETLPEEMAYYTDGKSAFTGNQLKFITDEVSVVNT